MECNTRKKLAPGETKGEYDVSKLKREKSCVN